MVRLETLFRALLDAPDRGISLEFRGPMHLRACVRKEGGGGEGADSQSLSDTFRTVFAPRSGMMRTFDKKNLGKRPPPFPHTPQKNLGRRVCVDRVEHIFCGASRDFFFLI